MLVFVALLAATLAPWLLPTKTESWIPTNLASTYNSVVLLKSDLSAPTGFKRHTITLSALSPDNASKKDALRLQLGTFGSKLIARRATLLQTSTECGWETSPATTGQETFVLGDLEHIELFRIDPTCRFDPSTTFLFSIETQGGKIAAFSWPPWNETPGNPRFQTTNESGHAVPIMLGFLTKSPTGANNRWTERRAGLMAYMWDMERGTYLAAFIFLVLASSVLIAAGGTMLLTGLILKGSQILIAGLLVTYCFATPPFQAPDEADHFRAFCNLTGRKTEEADAIKLANRGHYERLLCQAEETYTQADIGHPMTAGWPSHAEASDPTSRSALASLIWPMASKLFPTPASPGPLLLGLRLLNALYFFTAIFTVGFLLNREKLPINLQYAPIFAVISLPTLWHFGVHLSNYAFIISAYAVATMFAAPLVFGARLSTLGLATGGLVTGLGALGGRAGILHAGILLICWILRWFGILLTGKMQKHPQTLRTEFIGFLSWHTPIAALALLAARAQYFSVFLSQVQGIANIEKLCIALAGLVTGIVALLVLQKILITHQSILHRLEPWVSKGIIVIVVLFFLFMLFPNNVSPGPLPSIEYPEASPGALTYAWMVIKKFIATSSLGRNDFLLHESTWGGFGCPDRVLANWMIQIPKVLFMLLIPVGILVLVHKRMWREVLLSGLYLIACLAWLSSLAGALSQTAENIHGRYLAGVFLFFLTASYLNIIPPRHLKHLGFIPICLQLTVIWALSNRYFG